MKRLSFFLLFSSMAFGQGVILPTQQALKVVNGITSPVANATITVCAANASGIPCAPALVSAIFKDAALTQPLSNPFTSDANGNYVFAIAPGNYTVTVTAAGFSGYSYQTTAPLAGGANNAFGGNNSFTGSNTFTGATTLSGGGSLSGGFSVSAKSLNNVQFADQFSGSDPCAQILAAYNALPSTGGIVDARGFQGSLNPCAGGLTIGGATKIVDLLLGNATFTVNNTFNVACSGGNCHVYGINGGTVIFQGGSFPASTPVVQLGATGETNLTMSGVQVKCNSAANSIGVKVLAQDMSGPRQMIAQQCTKYGFWFEGANANNSTCYDCWALGAGATTFGFYVHTVNRWSGKNITSVANAGAGDPSASQIVIDGSTAYLDTFHVEDATNGLDVGPVASSIVEAHTGTGHATITSVVRVENISGNRVSAYNVILNGATNTVLDSLNTVTRTDAQLPMYMTQGPNGQQVDLFDGATGKLILIGGEAQFRDTAAGVDGRIGGGSFAAGQLGIGTANSNPTALYANSIQALKLETDGGNTLPKYSRYTETTAPGFSAGFDTCYGDSTAHAIKCNYNATTAFAQTQTIASGTAAMTTAAITAGNCGTTVTVAAANVATTDTITWAFNAAPAGSNAGIVAWPTSGNVNFAYCSNTTQTPAAATINWKVVR